ARVPSYAYTKTLELAEKDGAVVPLIGFEKQNELEIGNGKVINTFFGEAHTKDNIIHYIPSEELIFAGCMVKSLGASKGNLEDANLDEWSNTVQDIKNTYPNLKTVVPGHGSIGNMDLLDYTIELFKSN
ncbi:MAG: subclass B1 metallo-beta-lactamase, partial [Maribacter sp.]